jgi:hypothetical protein
VNDPRNPVALLLVRSSRGEVDWILPVLHRLRARGWRAVAVFESQHAYDALRADRFLFESLTSVALVGVYPEDVQPIFAELIAPERVRLILKDFSADSDVRTELARNFPGALVASFPNTTHLFGNASTDPIHYGPRDGVRSLQDVLLLGSDHDWPFWSRRADPEQMRTVGIPRYDRAWSESLAAAERLAGTPEHALASAARRVFVFAMRAPDADTIRPDDNEFLRAGDYQALVEMVLEETLGRLGGALLIKTQPGQDTSFLERALARRPDARWLISDLHLMQACSLADAAISMCAPEALDALAVGTPLVECFRFSADYPYWRRNYLGQPTSIYRELGLAAGAETREQLAARLDSARDRSARCWTSQRQAFELHCRRDPEAAEHTVDLLLDELARTGIALPDPSGDLSGEAVQLRMAAAEALAEHGASLHARVELADLAGAGGTSARALNNLGVLAWRDGRADAATALLRMSVRNDPRPLDAALNLLAVYLETRQDAPAAALLRERARTPDAPARGAFEEALRQQLSPQQLRAARELLDDTSA